MDNTLKNIIKSDKLNAREKAKRFAYYYARKRGAEKSWTNRHQKVLELHPSYNEPCAAGVESEHQKTWSIFRQKVDMSTLRICKNISGHADERIIPEDIYVSDVEPSLISDKSVDYISIKSFYNRWFPDNIFPEDLFHRIDGQYLNADLQSCDYAELEQLSKKIEYPIILKPNKDSYGGNDINIVKSAGQLLNLAKERKNFVAQKKIEQHDFFNRFHPESLNTIKVFIYRSVKDDKLHILSMALRMGKNGSIDNEAAGGVSTFIRYDDSLNGYAVDKEGNKYFEHPNTKIKFNCEIPDLDELRSLCLTIGSKVFYTRIFALDACYDKNGNWRIIELNTYGQSIRFSQYGGQPFFGKFTDEVIRYCRQNHWVLQ
jgi:hypothetical protein